MQLRGTVTAESLDRVLEHYRSADWQADEILVTGDLIQDDTRGAYEEVRLRLTDLGAPIHLIPGNHDVRSLMMETMNAEPFDYCASTRVGNWQIIGIDSCKAGQAGGHISADEHERLHREISDCSVDNIMICLHHPPVKMGSAWLDSVGLDDGDEFLAAVGTSGKVRLLVFGHAHQEYDGNHGELRILGTPATCRQFKPHSDEFALDNRSPGYRRIRLYDNGDFETETIWIPDA